MTAFPAAPPASSSVVSFVLRSPSTVIVFSVASTAARNVRRATGTDTRASVTTNTRSVAMFGAIIPPPFPSAATVTTRPPIRTRRTAVFGNASVVVIACAASANPSGPSAATAAFVPRNSRARSTCTPIRPVAHGATSSTGRPRSRAASAVDTSAVRTPCCPVHALAFPAWTRTADNRPRATRGFATFTEAAGDRLTVNTPAATAGESATINATSGPDALNPARTPANRNPGTRTRCARRASFTAPRPGSRRATQRSRATVALLVLLPGSARARVVPPDFVRVPPDGLDLRRLARRGRLPVRQRHPRRLPLPPLHGFELRGQRLADLRPFDRDARATDRRLGPQLDAHQLLDDVRLHAPDHVLEHVVPFLLVRLERIHLAVAAEADALLQVIHAEEMILPERIERLEHDELLEVARDRRGELLLALLVRLLHALDEQILQPPDPHRRALALGDVQPEVELREDRVVERLPVPLLGRRIGVGVAADEVLRDPLRQLDHVLLQIVA